MSVEEVIKAAAIKAVVSIPSWVPVAAAVGLVLGAKTGINAANDFGKKNGIIAGTAAAPFIVFANIIAGPFLAIKIVSDVMRILPIISSSIRRCTGILRNVSNNIWEMSDEEVIKVASTVGTAPLWVPVAAAGGLVYGAGKGLDAANEFGKKNGPLAGIAASPFIVGANIVAGPFRGIKKVGDVMVGKKKKK